MFADGDLYKIRWFPATYLFYVINFASRILFEVSRTSLLASSRGGLFRNTCYISECNIDFGPHRGLVIAAARALFKLYETFSELELLGTVNEDLMDNYGHEKFLKLVAELEFYGHIVQLPGSLKVSDLGLVRLDFLSAGAKRVIKRVDCQKVQVPNSTRYVSFSINYGFYIYRKRQFV